MARPDPRLIAALRETARRLRAGAPYRWSHQGRCNCGQLAQTLTRQSAEEIHRRALEKAGDWGVHAVDHCPGSGYPIDHVLDAMLAVGLERRDIAELEELASPVVLSRIPRARRPLHRGRREDAALYMETLAGLLEEAVAREAAALRRTVDGVPAPRRPAGSAARG